MDDGLNDGFGCRLWGWDINVSFAAGSVFGRRDAVIITIMVLEFKVPKADGFAGLISLAPSSRCICFVHVYRHLLVNHHHLIGRPEASTT